MRKLLGKSSVGDLKSRITSLVGVLLIVVSSLITVVVYYAYVEMESSSLEAIISVLIIWSSLCLPELVVGLRLLVKQETVETAEIDEDEIPTLIAYDVEPAIQAEDDGIPVLIAYDVDTTPEPQMIICTHCEYVFLEFEEVAEISDCPNCSHLVVPLDGSVKTTMNFPLVYNSLTLQHIDFIE
jgi:hypothetical protein